MKEKFIEFLREHGAYDEYKCERLRDVWRHGLYVARVSQHPIEWIDTAFYWLIAESGEDYWIEINNKWQQRLKELENGK